MDTTLAELRAIELREIELEREIVELRNRRRELHGLTSGTRKPRKDMISPSNGKALFAGLKRGSYELGKA